jgi:hypothetical protein
MATKSPTRFHNSWGSFATPADLPNVLGAAVQDAALEIGDTAYSISDTTLYKCDTATLGASVWTSIGAGSGAGSYLDWASAYSYTEALVPVEEVIGQGSFDGSLVGAPFTIYFRAIVNVIFTGGPGPCQVMLYDMGPKAGPPGAPILVATLVTVVVGGPQVLEQLLAVNPGGPGPNTISNTPRMYELTVIQLSALGDSVYIGSAGLDVR